MSLGKRGLLALGAALAAGALAAVALGQDFVSPPLLVEVKATPNQAGTPRHPQGVRIDVNGRYRSPDGAAPLVPRSVDVWLPKGWVYNGAKHPACTREKLNRGGPRACPPRSIMSGPEPAWAAVGIAPPRVTVINGGPTKMYFWVVLQNPARVQAAVPGTITKLRSSRWSYRLHAEIPPSLQVVAGVPITLKSFHVSVKRGDWIATAGCPRDYRWRYRVEVTSTSGAVVDAAGLVPCRN